MFTVEIRVNDSGPVGVLYVHNEGKTGALGWCKYSYRLHEIEEGYVTPGEVEHCTEDSIWVLVRKCIQDWEDNR